MYKSAKWQQNRYAIAALIIFCAIISSYIAIATRASNLTAKPVNSVSNPSYSSLSAYETLDNIMITNYVPPLPLNNTNPALISFSTGKWTIENGEGYLNITNAGNQNLTLALTMSAYITAINQEQTNYNLGSISIPNVTINGHSSRIISATINDTTPIVNWTEKPSGYWGYSWSVQASLANNPTEGYKTFDFNGSADIY